MTFGEVKSIIEESLLESYKEPKEFKKVMNEFHQNVLTNKPISKLYSLYDDLTSQKGLSQEESREYLEEGIKVIQNILSSSKLPKFTSRNINNKYSDLDTLVYTKNINISERIRAKQNLIKNLMGTKNRVSEAINLPISSMVSIANQTLKSYVDNMDENSKKDFLRVVVSDPKSLEDEFTKIRESAISKLQTLLNSENEFEVKTKISETIDRLKNEEFNQMNFVRLNSLDRSI